MQRHVEFISFFQVEDNLVYCNDIQGLMHNVGNQFVPSEWRLFMDSSMSTLKAVLLHNGNTKPSILFLIGIT